MPMGLRDTFKNQNRMKITNDIYLAPKERFPDESEETRELDPDEPSADEMDRADIWREQRKNARNGRGEV